MAVSPNRCPVPCRCCDKPTVKVARGLCLACYWRHQRHGTLHDFPRVTRRNADVIEDLEFLRAQGCDLAQAAERMGMTQAALERAIYRYRARKRTEEVA